MHICPFFQLCCLLVVLSLAACGGGGGGTVTPTPPADTAPSARAGADQSVVAGTAVTLDSSASTDAEGDTLTYRWSFTAVPPGSAAVLTGATTMRPSFTPDLAGVYVVRLVASDGTLSSAPAAVNVTASAPVAPQIVLVAAEPLSGQVALSLSGTVTGGVTWYIDLQTLGDGGPGATAPITWNTASAANGQHLVSARIQGAGGTDQEVRRTVTVANSSITLSASAVGRQNPIYVDVRATSPYGITGVAARFDDVQLPTLPAPNDCFRVPCDPSVYDIYRFRLPATLVVSGQHTLVFTATDGNGGVKSLTQPLLVSNAPVITLPTPVDGTLVFGSLRIAGTVVTDKAVAMTTVVRFGDVELQRTTATTFDTLVDLRGLAPGVYPLTVQATDAGDGAVRTVQRRVVVTSSAALVQPPLFAMPADAQVLAAEGNLVLYGPSTGAVTLRDTATGAESVLADSASMTGAARWQISGGRVFVLASGVDCGATVTCIHEWDALGRRTNLTLANPWGASSLQGAPVARDGRVAWINSSRNNDPDSLTVFETLTRSYSRVAAPAGLTSFADGIDLVVVGGVAHLVFAAGAFTPGAAQVHDVYRWRSDTGQSTRQSAGGKLATQPQTDGVRIAWRQTVPGSASTAVISVPFAGGATTTITEALGYNFAVRDGVLAWTEAASPVVQTVRAVGSGATAMQSTLASPFLVGIGGGRVVYGQGGTLWAWSAALGASVLLVDVAPDNIIVNGRTLVFSVLGAVYRVDL